MITVDTVMFEDVVGVCSSVGPRKQWKNYKNNDSAKVTKSCILLFITITDDIHHNNNFFACSHWRHVIHDSFWGDRMFVKHCYIHYSVYTCQGLCVYWMNYSSWHMKKQNNFFKIAVCCQQVQVSSLFG